MEFVIRDNRIWFTRAGEIGVVSVPAEGCIRGPAGFTAGSIIIIMAAQDAVYAVSHQSAILIIKILAGYNTGHAVTGRTSVRIIEVSSAEKPGSVRRRFITSCFPIPPTR